jgi:hypothetical protein
MCTALRPLQGGVPPAVLRRRSETESAGDGAILRDVLLLDRAVRSQQPVCGSKVADNVGMNLVSCHIEHGSGPLCVIVDGLAHLRRAEAAAAAASAIVRRRLCSSCGVDLGSL